ncbi:light-harvesting Chl a protein 7 [Guillardia theta CCMP2712]|uniref:Light-harvesting Chl a protein 7 n=3 Tax=Guillardia theta TaxID=55529 RepID=L1JDH6_GUITC|nr:light-harvesting Chl a protein 7 [Guillardia theta CCMP2712]EKX46165.1 light-harvesting Chl a protein 7 [Guillardia theta CCMP2712]|eukprot:XP_005833145.1 light-harvesting Chl a protein 7 [Guillardia theta CCMP2712]
MFRAILVAACVAAATAFSPSAPLARPSSSRNVAAVGPRMQAMSKSIPFLKKPAALDGTLAGDVGFDPLGLSSVADVRFLAEAELKHCRLAMLAALGAIVQDIFTFPGVSKVVGSEKMTGVHDILVKQGAMGQILLWVSFLEVFGTLALFETLDGKRAPGDFKFDPLGFGKNAQTRERYALAEVKNGRLAMLGFGGMVHGYFLTGKGPIEALLNFQSLK